MSDGGFIQRGGLRVAAQNTLTTAVLVLAPLLRGQWRDPEYHNHEQRVKRFVPGVW